MKILRNVMIDYALTLGVLSSSAVFAGDLKSFSQSGFDTARSSGKTVLVEFHAKWCSTCQRQETALESVLKQQGFENVVALKADYDKEMDLKKELQVMKQSTLLVFKGGKEVGRAMGLTDEAEIKKLLSKGI